MAYGWIDVNQFSFNTMMLMDAWLFRSFAKNPNEEFQKRMGIALAGNPAVLWYATNKCPEAADHYKAIADSAGTALSATVVRESEVYVLDALDWAVVYVYPEMMENLPYVRDWDPQRLLSICDFKGKVVLDIGAGTGRLAFAATSLAKIVYASEPVDRLREHMRAKAKSLKLDNMYVVDGGIETIPFADESFDIVMSGHVLGGDYDAEWREMNRVTRPGGWIIDCPGEEHRKKQLSNKLLTLGFEYSHYISATGGDVFRYWKQKQGGNR